MAACEDQRSAPGYVQEGKCDHYTLPHQQTVICCSQYLTPPPNLDWTSTPHAFQLLALQHSDALSYQECKHPDSLWQMHKFSTFNLSHAVQANQQLKPEASSPSGQPYPFIQSVKKNTEPSNPWSNAEQQSPIVSLHLKSRTVNATVIHGNQGHQTLISFLFIPLCVFFTHAISISH